MVFEILTGIFTGAPWWVWPLFLVLLFIGIRASKPRQTPLIPFFFLPLFGLISINSVASLPEKYTALSCFALGYLAGAILGYILQQRWLLGLKQRSISIAGEWFTLLTLMMIYWSNFVGGTVKAISPATYETQVFIGSLTIVIGIAAGSFLGRTIKIIVFYISQRTR